MSDRLEDQLTGDFFGAMRYIPFAQGVQKVLGEAYPSAVGRALAELKAAEEPQYCFWRNYSLDGGRVEPDVVIELPDAVICIEVKFNSGLSSDDEDSEGEILFEESRNQLCREARAIANFSLYRKKRKFLVFVAREDACSAVLGRLSGKLDGLDGFAVLPWTAVAEKIDEIKKCTMGCEKLIFDDVSALLHKKGFEQFRRFETDLPSIDEELAFDFGTVFESFDFGQQTAIREEQYYEFR